MTPSYARTWHALTALVAIAALVLQLALVLQGGRVLDEVDPPGTGMGVYRFFAYFTVESNLLVAAAALTLAIEAIHLSMRHAFDDLGYRRFEWKCDSLNEPSRRAAARLGFTYEGRFRNHMVTKGRNRDTDWFSVTDAEWPAVEAAHERWLDPANFDADGAQLTALSALTQPS